MMEEADLLKERLQAITDKRKIQESITMKRRQIEEEKLKLQYIKKKALREQWLMDGLSQQSEEEQAAMKIQAQDEQQQSDQLQSNILRIEKEIEDLETKELNISANEEAVLKRLKEVERTTEDIIKEANADFQADLPHHYTSPLADIPSFIPSRPAKQSSIPEATLEEPKKATFAMEISVEHDRITGKNQVVSTATITPETLKEKGFKVYDDGRKSVYALHPDGGKMPNGAVGKMTSKEVEELLHQAADKNVPTEVQCHQPVYSVPYTGNSRPSTPRTPNKAQALTPTLSPSQFQNSSRNGAQITREESLRSPEVEGWKTPHKTTRPSLIHQDNTAKDLYESRGHSISPQGHINSKAGASNPNPTVLVPVKARSEGMPELIQPVYRALDNSSLSFARHKSEVDNYVLRESAGDFNRYSPFSTESAPSLNLVNTMPEELESEPVTMIFMGYENAEGEEDEDIQAELVVIGNSDDDDENQNIQNESYGEDCPSYHPEGYISKVFQPRVGMAKVADCRDTNEDTYTENDDSGLHKPTFIHKPGKNSPYLQGKGGYGSNTGSVNMEETMLCSTGI